MLFINKKYESLSSLLEWKITDETYSIGFGLSKEEVISKIAEPRRGDKKDYTNEVTALVGYIYSVWKDSFNDDPLKFPFTFDDSGKSKVIKIANCYAKENGLNRAELINLGATDVNSSGFKFFGRSFQYGDGTRPSSLNASKNSETKSFTKYTNILKPQSLGLTGIIPANKLMKRIKDGLKNSNLTDSMKKTLYDLCRQLNEKKYDKKNIDDLIMQGDKGKKQFVEECKLSKGANADEIKAAINEIDKDFGEVLGAIILLNSIENATSVSYDTSVTGEMIDYTINTENDSIGVSAKALKGGHPPAASALFRAMREFVVSGKAIGDTTFDSLINDKDFIDKPDKPKEAKEFFILMEDIVDKSTKYQWFALIDRFSKGDSLNALKKFIELFIGKGKSLLDLLDAFGESTLERNFAKKFDEICNKKGGFNKIADVLSAISNSCGSKSKDIPTNADDAMALSSKKKLGIFIYPFESYIVRELNKNFGLEKYGNSDVDIISAFARLAFTHRQIYLGTSIKADNNIVIKYKIVSMREANWEFSTSGNSSVDPFSQVIGIHIAL